MQQEHAITYVTTIRNRFANEPETYRSFLKILHTYQKEQKGIKDVLEQVSQLFADHPDLLMQFTYFLPDAVQEQATERLHRAAREAEARRRNINMNMSSNQSNQNNMNGKRSRADRERDAHMSGGRNSQLQAHQQAQFQAYNIQQGLDHEGNEGPINKKGTQPRKNNRFKRRSELDEVAIQGGKGKNDNKKGYQGELHISMNDERQFFDEIKDCLTHLSRDSWGEFIKYIELFSNDAVTKRDLFNYVQELLTPANSELFDNFKRLISTRVNYDANPNDLWFSIPLSEIDFTQCRKCTPSYRALPKDYPSAQHSERSELEQEVCNDNWVSLPIGSEENTFFKHMRKNQYEEALFKCEDERFEIDMIIDSNVCTIRMLEFINDEINLLKQMEESSVQIQTFPKFSFQLEKRNLSSIHLMSITRIYGDHGVEMLELLRKNPVGTVPILLKRLKQKDLEWRKARLNLNKSWKEIQQKNFEKSFDHRSFIFRQQDKHYYTSRLLTQEIKVGYPEPGITIDNLIQVKTYLNASDLDPDCRSLLSTFQPNLSLTFSNKHFIVHRDIYRLMCHAVEFLPGPSSEKEKIGNLWRDLLRYFFNLPVHFLYNNSSTVTGSSSDYVYPLDITEAWPNNTRVLTSVGSGTIILFRSEDSMYKVQLPYGIAFMKPSCILGAEELSVQSQANLGATVTYKENKDKDQIQNQSDAYVSVMNDYKEFSTDLHKEEFIGTQLCYVFLRMYHTIYHRLSVAKDLSDHAIKNNHLSFSIHPVARIDRWDAIDDEGDIVSGTPPTKSPYTSFLAQLFGLIEGTIEIGRYEESCRQLLGNKSYEVYTLDKVVQRCVKSLQIMSNDDTISKLNGLFVYYRSMNGQIPYSEYKRLALATLATSNEEIYRMQMSSSLTNSSIGSGSTCCFIQILGTGIAIIEVEENEVNSDSNMLVSDSV